jgi:hypothetical protein
MWFDETAEDIKVVRRTVQIDTAEVNYCPLCHKNIKPYNMNSFLNGASANSEYMQKIIRCPSCYMLFLALFKLASPMSNAQKAYFLFERSEPYRPSEPILPENIKSISPSFYEIYSQAKNAEDLGLNDICGVGYRKALEFLIKDYLISRKNELGLDEDTIKKTSLGNCIKNHIKDAYVQEMAELATWLGNDETHYYRKWENKDLSDLKELIHLTMNAIDNKMISEKHKKDMKP